MAASSARDTTMFQIPLPVAQLVLSAINHITGQQPWLRELLASHAGRSEERRVGKECAI